MRKSFVTTSLSSRVRVAFFDKVGKWVLFACALLAILATVVIIFFIFSKGISTFTKNGLSIWQFLFSSEWKPDLSREKGGPMIGSAIFIIGSTLVATLAVLLSTPLSIAASVFMSEIAPGWGRRLLQPAIEILIGIPSVVYGYIGLSLLVPFIREYLGGLGFSLLAGVLVLTVMILPVIVSVSLDSLRSLSPNIKEASLALGATRWQTIYKVLIPTAMPGIMTGIIFGLTRAYGEALAVQMVIGNKRVIPSSLLEPATTLTSVLTMDMGYTVFGSTWNNALWSMAMLLIIITFFFILLIRVVSKRGGSS